MRILVEPSDYLLRNAGDMAMLHVAVTRLGELWPEASIEIFSDAPADLPAYCANSKPLDSSGRRTWFHQGVFFGGLRRRWPLITASILKPAFSIAGGKRSAVKDFLNAVSRADLLLVSGMGGITDAFSDYAFKLLETLHLAIKYGVVTVMVGQGIGPLKGPGLKSLAKKVLPRVHFIALREDRAGGPLLDSLGVPRDRLMTTGDDAIEMAYRMRTGRLGEGLGVNLRASDYAGVGKDLVAQIRRVLQQTAATLGVPMIPVPISQVPGEADADTIDQLIEGYPFRMAEGNKIDTVARVIEQIQCCRVVLTGSYHAGVFALASGIPVVCMANSDYYADKFLGLAKQFGRGCEVVFLNETDWASKMMTTIRRFWNSAAKIQPTLLEAAARQIELSWAAYRRIADLVDSMVEKNR